MFISRWTQAHCACAESSWQRCRG